MRLWVAVSCTVALSACSKKGPHSSSQNADDLSGTWVIGCSSNTGYPGGDHVIKTLALEGANYTYTQDVYSGSCSSANKVLTVTESGTYSVTGGVETNTLKDIDFTQNSLTATSLTSAETTALNSFSTVITGFTFAGTCFYMHDDNTGNGIAPVAIQFATGNPLDLTRRNTMEPDGGGGLVQESTPVQCGGQEENPANGSLILGDYALSSDGTKLQLGSPLTGQLGVLVTGKKADTIRPSTLDSQLIFTKQ